MPSARQKVADTRLTDLLTMLLTDNGGERSRCRQSPEAGMCTATAALNRRRETGIRRATDRQSTGLHTWLAAGTARVAATKLAAWAVLLSEPQGLAIR